jgi:hypothetical protein
MLQNIFRGLCRNSGGVILVAGAIGVLAGVKRFLELPAAAQFHVRARSERKHPGMPKPLDRFTVRRTRSELGYTYWVLQGFGQYTGFTLFDTWQEAMDEVQRRTKATVSVRSLTVAATATA